MRQEPVQVEQVPAHVQHHQWKRQRAADPQAASQSTLKRFKDEVKEVQSGQECGMAFTNYEDMQKGDVIECFDVETIQRAL